MSAENAAASEQHLLACRMLDALVIEEGDESNSDAPHVYAFGLGEVKVVGSLNLLQMADAILADGLGQVANADLLKARQKQNAQLVIEFMDQPEFKAMLAAVRADAWDEGHSDGQVNEHEGRAWRKIANPYRAKAAK